MSFSLTTSVLRLQKTGIFLALSSSLILSACARTHGPSVPSQPGKSFIAARSAVQACLPAAPSAGQNNVVGSYVAGVVLGGLVIGPVFVAANQSSIRYNGEARGVDRCLADAGYQRRDLTPAELSALRHSYGTDRLRLLDHFVAGGTLDDAPVQYSATN